MSSEGGTAAPTRLECETTATVPCDLLWRIHLDIDSLASRRTEIQTHAQADIATDRHTGNILVHDEETHVAVAFVSATLTNR